MAEFDLDKIADEIADKALDEFTYKGKTIREWVEIIVAQDLLAIAELEKIKARLNHRANEHLDGDYYVRIKDINEVFDEELAELKGENK